MSETALSGTNDDDTRSPGYHESPEDLTLQLRISSLGWMKRSEELNYWHGHPDEVKAKSGEYMAAVMAASYSAALADILSWVDRNDAEMGHEAACIADDMLMNGGSPNDSDWTLAEDGLSAGLVVGTGSNGGTE